MNITWNIEMVFSLIKPLSSESIVMTNCEATIIYHKQINKKEKKCWRRLDCFHYTISFIFYSKHVQNAINITFWIGQGLLCLQMLFAAD